MKRSLILMSALAVVVFSLSSFSLNNTATLSFAGLAYDFGQVKKGVPVSHDFEFTNPAGQDILITKVTASCGCTVTDYTKDAVAPGKSGFVKATYNAAKTGAFTKTVTVHHNGSETPIILTIKGEVVE